ncbi:MAG: prepilin-type N-terminal cleavage/methylation domain-containing protein [Phycisphaerae bacterium]|nr:prepilin-type N-terminal cleavage/methylation domain-containing protein [Phycisphaerae bacterium]
MTRLHLQLHRAPRRASRARGFNLVELLMALGISAALLTATMVSLNACFIAYQATTEEASTHTVSRLVMHRVLTMIRTGADFGPMPANPLDKVVTSDYIEFVDHNDEYIRVTFDEVAGTLLYRVGEDGTDRVLLAGVRRTTTPGEAEGSEIDFPAFTLEYEKGTHLFRVSMDLTIEPDDNQSTKFDRGYMRPIRLVASSMPRTTNW